jgi:hypothetical protein
VRVVVAARGQQKVLEDEKPDHQSDGFGWATGCSMKRTKIALKKLPWDGFG